MATSSGFCPSIETEATAFWTSSFVNFLSTASRTAATCCVAFVLLTAGTKLSTGCSFLSSSSDTQLFFAIAPSLENTRPIWMSPLLRACLVIGTAGVERHERERRATASR